MKDKVAIQGGLGSFHHEAASKLFKDNSYEILEKDHFRDVVEAVNKGDSAFGLIAIENTIAGSILPNYNLITQNNLYICGEVYLPIHQNLMVLPGVKLEEVKEVYSHSMALLQCEEYLNLYPKIRRIDYIDTAKSSQKIKEENLKNAAAIASKVAADMYGLEIIAPAIQTNKENYTRFVLLSQDPVSSEEYNKASIRFSLPHQTGSLSNVLMQFSINGLNLTKIQSFPIIDSPWQYHFFIDILVKDHEIFNKTIDVVKMMTEDFKILGKYINANV